VPQRRNARQIHRRFIGLATLHARFGNASSYRIVFPIRTPGNYDGPLRDSAFEKFFQGFNHAIFLDRTMGSRHGVRGSGFRSHGASRRGARASPGRCHGVHARSLCRPAHGRAAHDALVVVRAGGRKK
jgi:hypothetical protein